MPPYRPKPQTEREASLMHGLAWTADMKGVRGRCRGCAFRPGTAANRCGNVAKSVEAAAMWDASFMCHHATTSGPVLPSTAAHHRKCPGYAALFNPHQESA